jgi:membrane protein DedA with SNARE-associated domain
MSLSFLSEHGVAQLVAAYGYWIVAGVISLESMGLPLPGETILIVAAVYAGTTHELDIALVIAAAAAGAILGDNLGFLIGRRIGQPLLLRFGPSIGLHERRLKLGQYLFLRYGAEAVFLGRFVAILRALAALLAGANGMVWPRFLVANAAGGIAWASLYGLGAYFFGNGIHRLSGPAGTALLIAALAALGVGAVLLRRNEARLEDEAERAFPGPLLPRRPGPGRK